ncbi:DUF7115 domain-containing protein [Halonotius roseus]|uniref:DUF7115 domain-containing protein n=1 Tax=Halonotius roseus TaxID=2511997 RepID=A0A544QN74_9EURY|nr:hypothetical protein [Halonotius roseus]TQQ80363.1 hypothetical protein EWF95_07675 [Halonotius roseus]
MSLPDALTSALGDESAVAEVDLGGDDTLAVTPTRTLVYRAEGLLSDEAVEEYLHEAERLTLSEGRRKAKLTMEYGLDGTETLSLPSSRVDDALFPILAGVINAAGVTEPGESVLKTFRFSEITLIITSKQVVKHIGAPVWTEDFETFEYGSLTDVTFEEGSVATTVVLTHDGRQDRFKIPSDDARAVREAIVDAVCAFHDVDSIDALREQVAEAADDDPDAPSDAEASADQLDFGGGLDPLGADPPEVDADADSDADSGSTASETAGDEALAASLGEGGSDQSTTGSEPSTTGSDPSPTRGDSHTAGANASSTPADSQPADSRSTTTDSQSPPTDTEPTAGAESTPGVDAATNDGTAAGEFTESAFESAGPDDEGELAETVATLAERIDRQEEQLARQNELIETLIEELRRGR